MILIKKSFDGNHTMRLHFQFPYSDDYSTSTQFVVGGMVMCQFKVRVSLVNNCQHCFISVSEMFDTFDKSVDVCYPIVRSQCFGVNSTTKELSDDIIDRPNGIWHHNGIFKTGCKLTYDINFIVSISELSVSPSPFKALHEDTTLTDFELCAGDRSINVHKAVLAASSPVLSTMLSGQWKESSKGKLDMAGITEETLQDLIDFVYIRKVPDTKDAVQEKRLEDLFKLACYLMMSDLIKACTARFLLDLTDENVYEVLTLSVMHKIKRLTKGILLSSEHGSVNIIE